MPAGERKKGLTMGIVDLEQEFAASILNEALDRLCHRFAWNRDEAYGFLLGCSAAWHVHRGQSDARIIETVKKTLEQCRGGVSQVGLVVLDSAPKPPA